MVKTFFINNNSYTSHLFIKTLRLYFINNDLLAPSLKPSKYDKLTIAKTFSFVAPSYFYLAVFSKFETK